MALARALADRCQWRVEWQGEGQNGANISDLRRRVDRLDAATRADLVLISIGVNDVTGLSSRMYWRRQLHELIGGLANRWPDARVVFAGLPPMDKFPVLPRPLRDTLGMRAAILDTIAAGIVKQYDHCLHVPTRINPDEHDFCEDGFHPSAASCEVWARELALIVQQEWAELPSSRTRL